jgi:c-di-GMP-binding flagellar brake protein YcgR
VSTETEGSGAERRKGPRADVYHPIRFKLFSPDVRLAPLDGFLKDISVGGARIGIEDPYGQFKHMALKGLRTKLEIALPESEPVQLLCVVSWTRVVRAASSNQIDLGLEFADVEPWQVEKIQAFMAIRHTDQTMFWNMWDAYQGAERRLADRRQAGNPSGELPHGDRRLGERRR